MNAITGPTGIALGAITGLGGAALEMANKWAEAGNRIYEAAEKTGMSAEALSGVMAIAKETGHSFESISTGFARALRNIAQQADTGKGALIGLFTQTELEALKLKPVDEQLQTVLQRIFTLTNEGERNRMLQALLGRAWMENVGVLKLLANEGYGPAIEQAKKLNLNFDEKSANQAHQYGVEMHQLAAEISGLELVIGRKLVPRLAEWLAQLHTIPYETELLRIGLKAQGLSLVNIGGIFNKQLDDLAKQATDVFTAEHLALQAYKKEIQDLAGSFAGGPEGGVPGGPPKGGKTGAGQQAEDTEALSTVLARLPPVLRPARDAMDDFGKTFVPLLAASGPASLPLLNKDLSVLVGLLPQVVPPTAAAASATKGFVADLKHEAQALEETAKAMAHSTLAHLAHALAAGESLRKAAKEAISSIAEQAAIQAIWEAAQAFAMLALNFFIPDPRYVASAEAHFTAAAMYGGIAGAAAAASAGMGRGGGAPGAGREGRGYGGGYGEGRIGAGEQGVSTTGLAPGASGAPGGRLNVIVIGEAQQAAFFADAVNKADQAGHFMQVSSARRSAPAQG
jgi:hypothetical protein